MIASAKPFVPELPEPVQRVSLRGSTGVPMPAERPYDLGQTMEDMSAPSRPSELSASRVARNRAQPLDNPRAVAYESAYQPAPPPVASNSPVSAYAATRSATSATSGRGLY